MVYKCQLRILLPEGKHTIKRQLYSGPHLELSSESCIQDYPTGMQLTGCVTRLHF